MDSGFFATRVASLLPMTITFLVPRWFKDGFFSSDMTIFFTSSSILHGGLDKTTVSSVCGKCAQGIGWQYAAGVWIMGER